MRWPCVLWDDVATAAAARPRVAYHCRCLFFLLFFLIVYNCLLFLNIGAHATSRGNGIIVADLTDVHALDEVVGRVTRAVGSLYIGHASLILVVEEVTVDDVLAEPI